jgi:zinc D-Ala-D-Ala carboxypeptidase
MTLSEPSRRAAPRPRSAVVVALVVLSTALLVVLGYQLSAVSSSSATASMVAPRRSNLAHSAPHGDHHGTLGRADGVVPEGVTVFDDGYPAVANLDPGLLVALRRAAMDAVGDGVEFLVDSGWRSPEYQEQLLREAIARYGSEEEAARWVATPTTSAHVSGDAVDIGTVDAATWLSEHGADYGLCQIYRNEPWHYELRPEARDLGCPPMYDDATDDPRLQD